MYVKTRRLLLQPIRENDEAALVALLTDETVKQTYMVPDLPGREEANALARRIRMLSEAPGRYVAGIYLDDACIGLLNETDRFDGGMEVGYAILPRFHNRGYCTEALTGAIGFFFGQGFIRVEAGAFEENAASLRVMEKSGMHKIEKTDAIEYRGRTHRCVYYQAERP